MSLGSSQGGSRAGGSSAATRWFVVRDAYDGKAVEKPVSAPSRIFSGDAQSRQTVRGDKGEQREESADQLGVEKSRRSGVVQVSL